MRAEILVLDMAYPARGWKAQNAWLLLLLRLCVLLHSTARGTHWLVRGRGTGYFTQVKIHDNKKPHLRAGPVRGFGRFVY